MQMCIYKGCPWKSKLVNLNNHIQNCLFNPTKLPKFMKITNWFKEKENIDKRNINEEEEENNTTFHLLHHYQIFFQYFLLFKIIVYFPYFFLYQIFLELN